MSMECRINYSTLHTHVEDSGCYFLCNNGRNLLTVLDKEIKEKSFVVLYFVINCVVKIKKYNFYQNIYHKETTI